MTEYSISDDQVAILLAHLRDAGAVDVPTAEAKPISRDAARQLLDVLLRALKASGQETSDDIVKELNDWAYIVDESQGKAVVAMLSGAVFREAAAEIERLRRDGDFLLHALQWAMQGRLVPEDMADAIDSWEEARRG